MLAAVVSFCSFSRVQHNLEKAIELLRNASRQGAKAIFFPEATDYIASSATESLQLCRESSHFIDQIKKEAKENEIIVSIGVHELVENDTLRLFNSNYLIDKDGSIAGIYRKLHLFDVDIQSGNDRVQLLESKHTAKGTALIKPIQTSIGKIGLAICYDIRFPEHSLLLRQFGADILTYPSAFTIPTGEMGHWHHLLCARAIETQTYVIGAAQFGQHNEKRCSFGHALVVDPLGRIVAECENEVEFKLFEIDRALIERARNQIPVFSHRRNDIYELSHF
jgi:predicted amidohydrolase